MYVGLIKLEIWLDGSTDLKYKKSVLSKVKTRLKSKFNVAVAQVGENQEYPDFIDLGISMVGNHPDQLDSKIGKIIEFIDSLAFGRVEKEERDIIYYEFEDK